MTIYCYDTEFLEDGKTIDLISIGIVCEDGCEYYAVSSDFDANRVKDDPWLMEHVWSQLPRENGWLDLRHPSVKSREEIAHDVAAFLMHNGTPELWAYYAAYDHVALAQLWGKMISLPKGLPMYTHDLKQEMDRLGVTPDVVPEQANEHNALADAHWNLTVLQAIR